MANNVEVTGLKMNVQATNLARTKQQLDAVKKSLTALKIPDSKVNSIVNLAKGVSQFVNAVNKIDASKIDAFSQSIKGLGEVKIAPSVTKRINELGDAIKNVNVKELGTAASKVNAALEPLSKTMERISTSAKDLGLGSRFGKNVANMEASLLEQQEKRASKHGQDGQPVEEAKSKMDQFKESAHATAQQLDNIFANTKVGQIYIAFDNARQAANILKTELMNTKAGQFFMEVKDKANKAFSAIKQGAQKAVNAIKKIGSALSGYALKGLSMLSFMNPFKGIANSVQNVIKKVKNLGSSLARIAMYRALRSAIKEVAKAIKEGLNNLYQWSKATGGDFAPAVDKLATAMLYLKNSVGAAVSPLITYFAPAIDLAVDKIVDLINVINQLFARLTGRATWTRALKYPTEFAESAAGATKKVKDNIQDFDELHILRTNNGGGGASGQDYSKMFEETEFSQGLTEWILDFKQAIKNGRWHEAGSILADEVNRLINGFNWEKLGANLGDKITSMFQFAFGFLKNINFDKIGSSIADFLNNAIDHIDANLVGQTFARKWTMIVDTLYGFVTTFDWVQFGTKVSDFVEGWFTELDGYKIAVTISEAIKGALDAAIAFLSNDAMLDKFAEDIAGLINGIDWYGIFVRVLTLGSKILSAITTVIKTAISGTSDSNSLTNSYYSAISSRAGSSSVASRIASEMQSSNRNTVGFGQQLTDSIATSIERADTTGIANAIRNLFNEIVILIGGVVYELGMSVGVKWAEGLSDYFLGGHWDEDGNWVQPYTTSGKVGIGNQSVSDLMNDRANSGTAHRVTSSNTSAWATPKPTGKAVSYNDEARSATRASGVITKAYSNISQSANKSFEIQKSGFADLNKTVISGSKDMEGAFDSFGNKLSGEFVNKVNSSKNMVSATITSLTEDTKFKMNDMSNSIIGSIDNADKAVTTPLANIKSQITTAFKDAGTQSVSAIKDMGNNMKGALDGVINSSRDSVKGYKDIWDGLHSTVKNTSNSVIAGAESMGNGVTTAFNQIIRNLKNFKVTIPNIGDNKDAGKQFNFDHLQEIQKISIPRLATGGIATSPTTALIGEAGKEAVLPLENNTGWMDVLAERIGADGEELAVLREQNDLLRQIASKNVTISSRDVFNAVRDENDEYVTRTGKSALAL